MGELSKLPNISHVLEKKLNDIGILNPQSLCMIGSKEAFVRLWLSDPTACLSMLCALEGAVQGIRWHHLHEDVKVDLKAFHRSLG